MTLPLQPLIVGIDDEPDDIFLLQRLIQKTGVEAAFQPFANGEAAMRALSSLLESDSAMPLPLACFLDVKMAAMTGFDLLRWIRAQRPLDPMPVIMLSSSDDPRDVDTARELGAQAYMKKHPPVAAMRTVIDEARDFALVAPPKKAFLFWTYRFVNPGEPVPVK